MKPGLSRGTRRHVFMDIDEVILRELSLEFTKPLAECRMIMLTQRALGGTLFGPKGPSAQ